MEFDAQCRKLIEAVLEPLGESDELRDAVEWVAAGSQQDFGQEEVATGQATERMGKTARFFRRRSRWVTGVLLLGALAALWLSSFGAAARRDISRSVAAGETVKCVQFMDEIDVPPQFPYRKLPGDFGSGTLLEACAKQRIRMAGHDRFVAAYWAGPRAYVDHWKAIWDSAPEKASFYDVFALSTKLHMGTGDSDVATPAEFVETGERLDPGNGWFRVIHAVGLTSPDGRVPEAVPKKP